MTVFASKGSVVVTAREVEKIFSNPEAIGNISEVANADANVDPVERAATMAVMGEVLRQLQRAEQAAGAPVLTTPHHAAASRLQSLIASGDAAKLHLDPMASGGLEAKFDTDDWFGWAKVAWEKLKHIQPYGMVRPTTMVADPFPEFARVAILGDWGTGLYGAPKIAETVRNDVDPFTVLLHLGDVYYSGTDDEVQQRFLDLWPARPDAINRALNSNHEMYSGGEAYFKSTLAKFGQNGSYFALQNTHWTLVGLDVAYIDHAIDDAQVEWLEAILARAGDRNIVLFSHHQLYSHLEIQGSKLWAHPGFGKILRSKRIFAWYWGHEHRCTLFEAPDPTFGLWARCIGHSGMPQSRDATKALPRASEARYAAADWRRSPARTVSGNQLPSAIVLEGRNEFIVDEEEKFVPHGYAVLTFDGPTLIEQVRDALGRVIYENAFRA